MALTVTFQPGFQQSLEAASYFTKAATDLMRELLLDLRPRQYLITRKGKKPLAVRTWSREAIMEDGTDEILAWMRELQKGISAIEEAYSDVELVRSTVNEWHQRNALTTTYFLEEMEDGRGFSSNRAPAMALGIVAGHTVLLSTDRVMYVQLESGIYGLAVAGVGSYLIEHQHVDAVPVSVPRKE